MMFLYGPRGPARTRLLRAMAFASAAALIIGGATLLAAPVFAQTAAAAPAFSSDRISVEVVGEGPDVVLIPGLASSREVWRPLAEQLSATHRLHLVQIGGFAGEPGPAEGDVWAPAVQEIARYIREQGLERPAVIGHSLGGATGLRLAQDHPELIGRVMVVDALPFYSAMYGPSATAETAAPFAERAYAQVVGADDAAFAANQQGVARMMSKTPATQALVLEWSLTSDRHAIGRAMAELMTTDLRPGLAQITAPVTVLYAWDEAMGMPVARADALYAGEYASLPGVELVRIDGSLHFIMADQPERFAAEVERFLE